MRRTLIAFFVIALIFPVSALASQNIFYYFDNAYGLNSLKKNYKKIDVVAPQIYEVGYDLEVSKPKSKKILKEADKKNVSVMPLIVNDDFSKVLMSDILINNKAQDKIIDFMIKEAEKYDYIGWQFDFENINHLDRDLYTAFVKKTYPRLKEEGLQFSVAVVVRSTDYNINDKNQDWSGAYDYKELSKNSDFLSLMTYDDPNSIGPVASLPYVNRILDYMLTQAPAEKLSLGIPFYCWQWQNGVRAGATTYKLAQKNYKKGKNRDRDFDPVLGAEKFEFTKGRADFVIWCDNDESLEIKEEIIKNKGLAGFSAWALGQEDPAIWRYLGK
ncbi:MAG TPA: glycosyl hydrolase family 18 protein [Candidatus Paceibacterota bacterium]|nr:glycosyl hydrolase family 18 protein [Candidatus Paceibacterota bacterium]HRZ34318.1 glycosyl hydrolase family 18 protein [Candidatus Paceibacterota bacterium]